MPNFKPIAVIGQSCRFPGGVDSPESFWHLLMGGVDAVTCVPEDRFDQRRYLHPNANAKGRSYTFAAGTIGDVSGFDAHYFGISAREAGDMDPQQRLLLELTVEALERAGLPPAQLAGTDCGVYVGVSGSDYSERRMGDLEATDAYFMLGAALSITANRISHALDVRGPSLAVDTACSSTLAALHEAVNALQSRQCDLALVGAVNLLLSPAPFIGFSKARMLSRDGRCRSFAKEADGYVRAEGGGVLVLKPLHCAEADNDPILAVIRDVSLSTNGRTMGIALPSEAAQQSLLVDAYRRAHVSPRAVSYCEAHGTGTAVGDPIEAGAIGNALGRRRPKDKPLLIGSVKSNIGHLEPASGMAGLIKGLAILHHGIAPPSLHCAELNPNIDFDGLNIRVVREATPVPQHEGRRVIGINSFGFGGTNAHAILESYLPRARAHPPVHKALPLVISGRTEAALAAAARSLETWLSMADPQSWYDIAYTAACRRNHYEHRWVLRAEDLAGARAQLAAFTAGTSPQRNGRSGPARGGKLGLIFVGNGSQWAGMGVRLLNEDPVFRAAMERIDAAAHWRLGWSLIEVIAAPQVAMDDTRIAQPLLFALQVALVESLRAHGLDFDGVLGHSVGEVAAAHVAGALTLKQALLVIRERSAAQATTRGKGKMMVVALDEPDAADAISIYGGAIEIAAVNGPRSITLSGATDALYDLQAHLKVRGVGTRVLDLDFAFHSATQDATREQLLDSLRDVDGTEGPHAFYSSVTGEQVPGSSLTGEYWWRNVRERVRFAEAIERMEADGFRTFLEVGPNPLLQGPMRSILKQGAVLRTLGPGRDGHAAIEEAVDGAYALGAKIAFDRVFNPSGRTMDLPTYPWQRERHWYEATPEQTLNFASRQDASLLGARIDPHVTTWENLFDPDVMPFLADHSVDGTAIGSATTFIELAFEAAGQIFGPSSVEIQGFKIHRPLVLDIPRVVRFTWLKDGGYFRIESREHMRKSPWVEHVSGRLSPLASMPDVAPEREVLAQPIGHEEHYDFTRSHRFSYGPSFQVVQSVSADESIALAELRATDFSGTRRISPELLDGVLQTIFPILRHHADGEELYLPSSIDRIYLRDAGVAERWTAQASLLGREGRSLLANAALRDAEGVAVAIFQNVRLTSARFARATSDGVRTFSISAEPLDALSSREVPPSAFAALIEWATAAAPLADADQRLLDEIAGAFAADALLSLDESADLSATQTTVFARLAEVVEVERIPEGDAGQLWRETLARKPYLVKELALLGHAGSELTRRLAPGFEPVAEERAARGALLDGTHLAAAGRAALLQGVAAFCATWPVGRRLRVLDVSDGGEDLLRALVQLLPADRSDLMVAERNGSTRRHGLETPGAVRVEGFDRSDPLAWPHERFDLIVGVHVTSELDKLHELAKPGAALVVSRPRMTAWTKIVLDLDRLPALPSVWAEVMEIRGVLDTIVIGRAPSAEIVGLSPARHTWRIAAGPGERGLADALARALSARGQTAAIDAEGGGGGRLVHLDGLTIEGLEGQAARVDGVVDLLKRRSFEELVLVTHAGLALADDDATKPEQALLAGVARVLVNETPSQRVRLVDLHGDAAERIEDLADEIVCGEREEVILDQTGRFALRLDPTRPRPAARRADEIEVLTSTGSSLDRLTWGRAPRREPMSDEVEIEVAAVGLNFRDVMFAMGVLPPEMLAGGFAGASLGMEASGRISRIGPGVKGLAVGDTAVCFAKSALASHVTTRAYAVFKLPSQIGCEAGATVLTAFFTAVYSLSTLARLKKGERVLIHGAAGGVGLAALQYARHIGAEVFVTAGSDEKRTFVTLSGVDADHVLNSRSTDFASEIRELTRGEGVDVVLNSLAGEAMYQGLSLLRPFGRFIELGKVDFLANSRVGLNAFRHNIAYHGVDADELLSVRRDMAAEVLTEVLDLFSTGVLTPLPYRTFSKDAVVEAFRHMQRARHIGKIVIRMEEDQAVAACPPTKPVSIDPDGAYLVSGGLSGVGLAAAEWLVERGARHLVLVSRTGRGEKARIDALRSAGVRVDLHACDVSDEASVGALVDRIGPRLKGVIHAAAVYDDGRLADLTPEGLRRVLAPKALGALALDAATRDLQLDLFLLLSSISALIGNPGQGNYVAANMVLEALAAQRRAAGRAAKVVALAPVIDVGHLTKHPSLVETFERLGLRPLNAAELISELDALVLQDAPGFLIADVNWGRLAGAIPSLRQAKFRAVLGGAAHGELREGGEDFADLTAAMGPDDLLKMLLAQIRQEIAKILRVPVDKLDVDVALTDLGMDSLMGVELSLSVEGRFRVSLPAMALAQDISIRGVANLIRDQITGASPTQDPAPAAPIAGREQAQILLRHGEQLDTAIIAEALVELEEGVPARLIS